MTLHLLIFPDGDVWVSLINNNVQYLKLHKDTVLTMGLSGGVIPAETGAETKADFRKVMPEPWRVCLDGLISNGTAHSSMQPSSTGAKFSPYLTIIPQTKKMQGGFDPNTSRFEFSRETPVWLPVVKCQPTSIVLSLRDSRDNILHIDPLRFNFCCELRIKLRMLLSFA